MCGVAGFSLSPSSTLPVKRISRHLLRLSEPRGRNAAGYAHITGNKVHVYKRPVLGGAIKLRSLPDKARTVLLHTRNMTVGDCKVTGNNHPVISPNKRIHVIHNGVIANHEWMRERYPNLPEVDSAVIPSLIDEFGVAGLGELSMQSWAALGWFDTDTADTLHLATTQGAPLVVVSLKDGSLIFCSTLEPITEALTHEGLADQIAGTWSVPPFTYLRVVAGAIVGVDTVPEFSYKTTVFKDKMTMKLPTAADLDKMRKVTMGNAPSAPKTGGGTVSHIPVKSSTPSTWSGKGSGYSSPYSGGSAYPKRTWGIVSQYPMSIACPWDMVDVIWWLKYNDEPTDQVFKGKEEWREWYEEVDFGTDVGYEGGAMIDDFGFFDEAGERWTLKDAAPQDFGLYPTNMFIATRKVFTDHKAASPRVSAWPEGSELLNGRLFYAGMDVPPRFEKFREPEDARPGPDMVPLFQSPDFDESDASDDFHTVNAYLAAQAEDKYNAAIDRLNNKEVTP